MGHLFLGNGTGGGQFLAAIEVVLSRLQLGLAHLHLRLHAIDIAVQPAYLAHRAGQVGLGTLQADLGIAGIELE
ncbi:hypothetical protein D3C87_1875700 [compost metagenome]